MFLHSWSAAAIDFGFPSEKAQFWVLKSVGRVAARKAPSFAVQPGQGGNEARSWWEVQGSFPVGNPGPGRSLSLQNKQGAGLPGAVRGSECPPWLATGPTILQGGGDNFLRRRSSAGPVAGLHHQAVLGELVEVIQGVDLAVPSGVDADDVELEVAPSAVLPVTYLVATDDPILQMFLGSLNRKERNIIEKSRRRTTVQTSTTALENSKRAK